MKIAGKRTSKTARRERDAAAKREKERCAALLFLPEDESKDTLSHYGCLAGVKVDGENVEADVVVIAMGPWTKLAASWFEGIPHIGGQKAHSIVVQPASAVTADCLFLAHTTKQGGPSIMITRVF